MFEHLAKGRLAWLPELGAGFYPVETGTAPYDAAYFERFARQADSDIGRALMAARCAFVARHHAGGLVDVGIGSGAFIEARIASKGEHRTGWTCGYDVNPAGRQWLTERNIWLDPNLCPVDAVSLWDVLEHIADFRPLVANVRKWLFVSLPIFRDAEHVLASKHYRRDEHCWYFTRDAFVGIMDALGFECVEENGEETALGREDIGSFAFRRVHS